MKKLCILFVLLVAIILPTTGCATLSGGGEWDNDISQLKADIFMFSKLATRVALNEANMSSFDAGLIEGYLMALKDFLAVPGQPNFTGARALVETRLPQQYQVYGLTIIDVLERYLRTTNLNVTEDQETIIALISSGINGALEAVEEFKR